MVRPVLAQGRVGVRSGPRRVPLGGGGRPGPFGGGYGVHTVISESGGEYRVRLFIDGEYQAGADYFTDDVVEANETAKAMEEDAYLSDKSSDVARGEAEDFVEDAIDRPHVGEEFSALPSADRAMLTHAASGEPPRLGRAHPERPAAPYEPSPRVSPEQVERNREGIRRARETLRNPPVDIPLPKGDQGMSLMGGPEDWLTPEEAQSYGRRGLLPPGMRGEPLDEVGDYPGMEAPDMGNAMASYEGMLDSLPDRAAAALERRQATSGGNPLGNAPDWLDEVLLMIAAGGAATLLAPAVGGAAGGAALLGGAAMLAQ